MTKIVICYGPPNSDRSEQLLRKRFRTCPSDPFDFLYLVASQWRKGQLQRTFLEEHPEIFEVPVLTFQEFMEMLAQEMEYDRQLISGWGKKWLLGMVVEEHGSTRHTSNKKKEFLLSEALHWVSLLKRQGFTSESLVRIHLQQQECCVEEIEWLIQIFLGYQKKLKDGGWEDAAGIRLYLYEALLTGTLDCRKSFPGLRELIFEGLIAPTLVERGLVRLLSEQVCQTTFSVDLDASSRDLDRFSEPVALLEECWGKRDSDWRFFPASKEVPPILFSRSTNRELEVRMVAGRILDLKTQQPHLRWSQIGILCPHDEGYLRLLREIFSQGGVPWVYLHGDSATSTYAFSTVLGYVGLLLGDFKREDLFDFLSSPWLDLDGISADQLQLLERLAWQEGFSQSKNDWGTSFASAVEGRLEESTEGQVSSLGKCIESFRKLVLQLQADCTLPRTAANWLSLLANRLDPILQLPPGLGTWARVENLALERILEGLNEIALLWGDCPLSLERFRSLLLKGLSGVRIPPAAGQDAVAIGDIHDLQECEFQHLFWLDFSEGRMPSRQDRIGEELSLFHGLRCRTSKTVLLSCPSQSERGAVLPSFILDYLNYQEIPSCGWDFLDLQQERAAVRQNISRGIESQYLRGSDLESSFGGFLSQSDVLSQMRLNHFPSGMQISTIGLENYKGCGFRYFVRAILKVKPFQLTHSNLIIREQGLLIHKIVSRFLHESEQDGFRGIEKQQDRMADIAREELKLLKPVGLDRQGLVWEQFERFLIEGLRGGSRRGLLAHFLEVEQARGSDFKVHSVETSLGPLLLGRFKGDGKVTGEQSSVPVNLLGVVDRINQTSNGFEVINYKMGGESHSRRIRDGWGFELPLDLLLVQSFLGKVSSGENRYMSLPSNVGWWSIAKLYSKDKTSNLAHIVERYREKALTAARDIHAGRFPVTSLKPVEAGCPWCDFSKVCRRDEVAELVRPSTSRVDTETKLLDERLVKRWDEGR